MSVGSGVRVGKIIFNGGLKVVASAAMVRTNASTLSSVGAGARIPQETEVMINKQAMGMKRLIMRSEKRLL